MGETVNYQHKDRLFRFIFGESRDNALSLYNAVNRSSYTNADDLVFNTMDNFLYIGMKNDVSFLFQMELHLYEHQSTVNPNLPLRGLSYLTREMEAYVELHELNVFGERLAKLPTPHYVVFYNGTKDQPEVQELRLSDAFEKPGGCVELRATVYNINAGHNPELLGSCRPLHDYAALIGKIRENQSAGLALEPAVRKAVDDCIRENILSDVLKKHKSEVIGMLFTEYDEEKFKKLFREEGRAEGRAEGRVEGILRSITKLMDSLHWPVEQCMDALDVPSEERAEYRKRISELGWA